MNTRQSRLGIAAWLVVLSCAAAPSAWAVGGGGDGGSTGFTNRDTSPGQQAILEYQTGEKRLDRARELRAQAAELRARGEEVYADKIEKLDRKSAAMLDRAEQHYRKALDHDESLHQAWSSLGYTLRQRGRHPEALAAYDRALALEPRYAEAVEYRAEAYLELGRLDDAKRSYVQLVGSARPFADELMAKMEAWVEDERAEPSGLEPARVEAFAAWIEERKAKDGPPAATKPVHRARW
jgi:tetratricopeptide (TPR) repeat protein